jgi:hypothetical protein
MADPKTIQAIGQLNGETIFDFWGTLVLRITQKLGPETESNHVLGQKMFSFNTHHPIFSWLVVWKMMFMTFHILGMSSSQLIFIFFRGVGSTTNQVFFQHPPANF